MVDVAGDGDTADRGTVIIEGDWTIALCEECLVFG